MAICEACGQEMNSAQSCKVTTIDIDDVDYNLVPYGQETRFGWKATASDAPSDARCHDCGVPLAGFHHPGCDVAECPRCHGQLLTCDCLDDQEDHGEELEDGSIGSLFDTARTKESPEIVTYNGQTLVRADRFPVQDGEKLKIIFEHVGEDWAYGWRQGICLDSDLPSKIEGFESTQFVLWSDTAPPEVIYTARTKEGAIWAYNAWDTGDGTTEAWIGNSAMIIEELSNGRRYRCNDAYPDDDFDDLVFRVERHAENLR